MSRMELDPVWHGLKVGDLATWAGAAGSILAAVAAVVAAGIAIRIARLPIDEAKRNRQAFAKIIAAALLSETIQAERELLQHVEAIDEALKTGTTGPYISNLMLPFLAMTNMMERFVDKLDAFGRDRGIAIAQAVGAVVNMREVAGATLKPMEALGGIELGVFGASLLETQRKEFVKAAGILEQASGALIAELDESN